MEFKEKVLKYLENNNVKVGKIEQEGNTESIVCHISTTENKKIEEIKNNMEEELNVIVQESNMFGMNVVLVESKDIE